MVYLNRVFSIERDCSHRERTVVHWGGRVCAYDEPV